MKHIRFFHIIILSVLIVTLSACAAVSVQTPAEEPPTTAPVSPEPEPIMPALDRHVPFLFCDEHGFIRPDDELTSDELHLAISCLLTDGEVEIPNGDIRQVLSAFFSPAQLDGCGLDEAVTRSEFARIINELTGRSNKAVLPQEGECAPVDIGTDDPLYADVMEACTAHFDTPQGELWQDIALDTGCEPGLMRIDGSLYCIGADGRIAKDRYEGVLYFGTDGRYTSGDAELDTYVDAVLGSLYEQYPDGDDMLRHIFDYVRESFEQGKGAQYEKYASGWETEEAKAMFETGSGNCFGYTAVFSILARAAGYPVEVICRPIYGLPHSWAEMTEGITAYVYDPAPDNEIFAMTYREARHYGYQQVEPAVALGYGDYSDVVYTEATEKGTVEVSYGENGETFLVYLPYEYDESKQYNVLLYLNGADGNPYKMLGWEHRYSHGNFYFCADITTRAYMDFLIQYGYCEPFIVVSTNTTLLPSQIDRYLTLIQYTVDNYSTYAEDSSVESLIEAREHFAIAGPSTASQSVCVAIQELPDIFAYYGLFSGMYQEDATLEAFKQKQNIKYLVMAAGDSDYLRIDMEKAYEVYSHLENVEDSFLMIPSNCDHDWTAFDGAIRELLLHFTPRTGTDE